MNKSAQIKVGIIGASGRMGLELCKLLKTHPDAHLCGALVSETSPLLSQDINKAIGGELTGIQFTSDLSSLIHTSDLIIDFSSPVLLPSLLMQCCEFNKPLLIGTTGYDKDMWQEFEKAAQSIPLLVAPNTSIGIAVVKKLASDTAGLLGPDYQIKIKETHHIHKKDAPSGTALSLGKILETFSSVEYESYRTGEVIGDHSIIFTSNDDIIEISHKALSRSLFAKGALKAALWLYKQPANLYSIEHSLGL